MAKTTTSKVDEKAALKALSSISKAVADKRADKRAAEEADRIAKRDARKAGILEILDSGKPTAKSDMWGIRYALAKAVTATKLGATADELLACKALQAVTTWGDLIAPVTDYCEAMAADAKLVLAGLISTETTEAPSTEDDLVEEEPAEMEADASASAEKDPAEKGVREPRQRKPKGSKKRDTRAA